MNRIIYIDNLRGIAFILMILHHIFYFYDVSKNYKTKLANNIFINIGGILARNLFIFLAGVSLYISYSNNKTYKTKFYKTRFYRSLEILFHALIISLVTYLLYPNIFIRFGILHFMALATLLCSVIVQLEDYYLIILLLFLLQPPKINNFIDTITGSQNKYNMMDWFPLFEWLPIMIFGMFIAKNVNLEKLKLFDFKILKTSNLLTYLGKNTLNLYTLHVVFLLYFYYLLEHSSLLT
jgi:hypothetical protein